MRELFTNYTTLERAEVSKVNGKYRIFINDEFARDIEKYDAVLNFLEVHGFCTALKTILR